MVIRHFSSHIRRLNLFGSSVEGVAAGAVQVLRRSPGCCRTWQFTDARPGVCVVCVDGECRQGSEGCSAVPAVLETDGVFFLV